MLNTDCPGCAQARNDLAYRDSEIKRLGDVADRANASMLKHQKHNGAMEMAVQDAHQEIDALKLQNDLLMKEVEGLKRCVASEERNVEALDLQRRNIAEKLDEQYIRVSELHGDLQESNRLIADIAAAWKEQKAAQMANVPSGEFKEDDLRGDRVSAARKRLVFILDAVLTPEAKQKDETCPEDVCPHCYHNISDPAHRSCISSDNRK